MGWKKQVDEWKRWSFAMRDVPFEYVKKQLVCPLSGFVPYPLNNLQAKGLAKPSFTSYLLEHFDERSFDEKTKGKGLQAAEGMVRKWRESGEEEVRRKGVKFAKLL